MREPASVLLPWVALAVSVVTCMLTEDPGFQMLPGAFEQFITKIHSIVYIHKRGWLPKCLLVKMIQVIKLLLLIKHIHSPRTSQQYRATLKCYYVSWNKATCCMTPAFVTISLFVDVKILFPGPSVSCSSERHELSTNSY